MKKLFFVTSFLLFYIPVFAQTSVNDGYGDYLLVTAGEFQMGDNFNEGASHEKPIHTVNLDAYYIGKFEVTNGEYKKFMDDGGYTTEKYWTAGGFGNCGSQPLYWDSTVFKGGRIAENENFPVIGVNRYEANAYCMWLSVKTGKNYRLPTEAEWEKAARGTDQRKYPWGNNIDGSYANYDNSGDTYDNLNPVGYYNGNTHGSFSTHNNASPYGAYDMAGNVWEWCNDWYDSNFYSNSPINNPAGSSSGSKGVIRGGSWKSITNSLRSANRGGNDPPSLRYYTLGFRCVREP